MRRGLRLVVLVLLFPAVGCRCSSDVGDQHGRQRSLLRTRQTARELEQRAAGLEVVRRVLFWHEVTGREPGRTSEVLAAGVSGLTFDRLFELRRLENSPGVKEQERRQLRYLRSHLTLLVLQRRAAKQTGHLLDLFRRETIEVPGREQPVRFNDSLALVAGEADRRRRGQLEALRLPTLRRLDRLLQLEHRLLRQEAKKLGVSCFALMEEREERDTRSLVATAVASNQDGDDLFREVWSSVIPATPTPTLGDLRFVLQGGSHQPSLCETKRVPALERLLQGMGLEPIRVLDRGLVTVAVPVDPPRDVRLAYTSEGGVLGHVALFEAAGRAVCWANLQPDQPWVFRSLGPQLGVRALGYLFGLVWMEPAWWKHYRELKGGGPGPTDDQVTDLMHSVVLAGLIRLRVAGVVVPVTRVVLQGGPARTYEGVLQPGAGSASAVFARLMERQLGLELGPAERLSYVDELDPSRHHLDLRAYALAHQLREKLLREHGGAWFTRPDVVKGLVKRLCSTGSSVTMEQLVQRVGLGGLELEAPWRAFSAAWHRLHGG